MRTDEVGGEVPGWESLIATVPISTAPSLDRSLACTHEDDRSRLARGADLLTSELKAILTYLEGGNNVVVVLLG
jgi:hypothetical protein